MTGHLELEELFRKAGPGRRLFITRHGAGFKLDHIKSLIDEILQKKHEIDQKRKSNIRREEELDQKSFNFIELAERIFQNSQRLASNNLKVNSRFIKNSKPFRSYYSEPSNKRSEVQVR